MIQERSRACIFVVATFGLSVIVAVTDVRAQSASEQASATSETGELAEIVVTAQRREENLQSVPVTVNAFDARALADANVLSASDLTKLTPSLLAQPNATTVTTFLRGIGTAIAAAGNEASVAYYVDGIYYSRVDSGLMRLNDVERVEVLSGPQGTLFGRNSSGGLIQVITRDPQPGVAPTLDASIGYGNYQTTDANVYASSSLGSRVAADVALVVHDQSDGWGRDIFTGAQTYTDKHFDARTKLVFDVDDATKAKLAFDYEHADTPVGMSNRFFDYPQGYPDGSGRVPQIGFYDTQMDGPQYTRTDSWGVMGNIQHNFGTVTLSDTASYRHEAQAYGVDLDETPQNYLNAALPFKGEQESNELQLISNGKQWLNYVAGVYYLHQIQQYVPGSITGDILGGLDEVAYGHQNISSYAGYAQATAEVLPKLNLTLGGRYSRDELDAGGYVYLSGTGIPGSPVAVLVPPSSADSSFGKFTYKAALDYELIPDVHTYLSVSEGFKSATYSLFPFSNVPALPEVLTAYEIGAKTEWLDHRLRVNGSVFYYHIKDPQVDEILTPGSVTVANAQAAKDTGFDLESEAQITKYFSLRIGLSLLDAQYTDYPNAPTFPLNPAPPYGNLPAIAINANGQPLPYAPHTSVSVGAKYVLPSPIGQWELMANFYNNSGYSFNPDNLQRQPEYHLLDAQVAYTFPNTHVRVRAWGSNLTNTQYYTVGYEQQGSQGNVAAPAPPRMYGLAFEVSY